MGGGGGTHQSDNIGGLDQLGYESILGMLSGQGVTPSPAMSGSTIAAQLGGKYNADNGEITFPDGTRAKLDPSTGQYVSSGGSTGKDGISWATKKAANDRNLAKGLDPIYSIGEDPGNASSEYLNQANAAYKQFSQAVYDDPNSAYNLYSAQDAKTYNPATGKYEAGTTSIETQNADYYMGKYGDFYDKGYNQFDYNAPQLEALTPISDTVRQNIYQSGADQIVKNFQDINNATDEWVAMQGSNLSSGRAGQLKKDDLNQKNEGLSTLKRNVDNEFELRNYDDAKYVRDTNADYKWQEQGAQAGENRYGYESDYNRGKDKLGTAEAIDSANRDRGFGEYQADRQQNLNRQTALNDLLRVYAGMDSTAAQLEAAKAQGYGSALSGLFGAAGSAVGG